MKTTIEGAENVLLNVTGGMDMSLIEAQDASEIVIQAAGNDVNIMLGTAIDPNLKDEIRVTVVATGVAKEDADEALGLQPEPRRQPNLTHNSNMQHAQQAVQCKVNNKRKRLRKGKINLLHLEIGIFVVKLQHVKT